MLPEQLAKQFGILIANRRRRMGLKQRQLAERLGITRESISRIENGHDLGRVASLSRLADALEVNLSTLVREAEDSGAH